MANVYNWQIERQMEYPYEGARPKRQFAAVFDLNKCIGCQTCTMACKTTWTVGKGQEYMQWNNVETKPYGGLPEGGGRTGPGDEAAGTLDKGAYFTMPTHDMWFFYLPRICMHCTYPACLASCPRQAIYKREEDGIVLVDQTRCRGYRECVQACPYGKVLFNPVLRISQKCIGCYPAVEQGMQPRCVTTCIGKIRLMGFLSKPDEVKPHAPMDFL